MSDKEPPKTPQAIQEGQYPPQQKVEMVRGPGGSEGLSGYPPASGVFPGTENKGLYPGQSSARPPLSQMFPNYISAEPSSPPAAGPSASAAPAPGTRSTES